MPVCDQGDRAFWDGHWAKSPRVQDPPTVAAQTCARLMKEKGLKKVLDLGCGQGRDAIFFFLEGLDVTAADISSEALEKARSIACASGAQVRWVCDDLFATEFGEAAFDAVCAVHFVHLFRKPQRREACRRIARLLAPGGYAVMIGISKADRYYSEFTPTDEEDSRIDPHDGRVVHFFAPGDLEGLLRETGFEVLSCEPVLMHEDHGNGPHAHEVWLAVARKPDSKTQ